MSDPPFQGVFSEVFGLSAQSPIFWYSKVSTFVESAHFQGRYNSAPILGVRPHEILTFMHFDTPCFVLIIVLVLVFVFIHMTPLFSFCPFVLVPVFVLLLFRSARTS